MSNRARDIAVTLERTGRRYLILSLKNAQTLDDACAAEREGENDGERHDEFIKTLRELGQAQVEFTRALNDARAELGVDSGGEE